MNRSKYEFVPGKIINADAGKAVTKAKTYLKTKILKQGRTASVVIKAIENFPTPAFALAAARATENELLSVQKISADCTEMMAKQISLEYDAAIEKLNGIYSALLKEAIEAGKAAVEKSVFGNEEPTEFVLTKAWNIATTSRLVAAPQDAATVLKIYEKTLELAVDAAHEALRKHCRRMVTGKFN